LVALTHASNVTGTIQPVAEIAEIVRKSPALFLIDAAQTAGHVPIDVTGWGVDLLATSGHKGLGGPLGTGMLFIRPGLERELVPLRFGGTGSHSECDEQPYELPDRYESGNHNAPGLVGLDAALEQVAMLDLAEQRVHEQRLTGLLIDELRSIPGVTVHVPGPLERQLGVVSISVHGFEPQIRATLLDQEFGVQTRAGLHCAPRAHAWLGTLKTGGTVRFSLGYATTEAEILAAAEAMRMILGG
jgi:selenocysteine lyase/cysteine desulfurase